MPVFFISNRQCELNFSHAVGIKMVTEKLPFSAANVYRNTLDKFMQDKVFAETAEAVMVLDGYVLNKAVLLKKYQAADMKHLLWRMYQERGEKFFCRT